MAVDTAIERGVDAIVHTGNVFRKPSPGAETVRAITGRLDDLAAAGIKFLVVEGPRESHGDALDRLADHESVRTLDESPTRIGDVVLYGVEYTDNRAELLDELGDLQSTDAFTYNVVCMHHQIWPPVGKHRTDTSSFDVMDATDIHVDEILAGGLDEARTWESDDFDYRVTYSGPTNPAKVLDGDRPVGTLLEVGTDSRDAERLPLNTTSAEAELAHLRDALDYDRCDLGSVDTETLVDLYGLAARAKSVFEDRRTEVRDELLDRIDEDQQLDGTYATVDRQTQRRRRVRSSEAVLEAVERADIDRTAVLSVDASTVRDLVDEGKLDESDVLDVQPNATVRLKDVSL